VRRPSGSDVERLVRPSTKRSVDQFLSDAARARLPSVRTTHRLLFALDATASRQITWDLACELHTELFNEAARLGNIAIQLCYYRGLDEFVATPWTTEAAQLEHDMSTVRCRGGRTQIGRLLDHATREASLHPVRTLVFIGDCFEEDEVEVMKRAGQLAIRQLPVFVFQERGERRATRNFKKIAAITHGAHAPFDSNSPGELRRLLAAVAHYTTGGRAALEDCSRGNDQAQALLVQLESS
jgi:hypothetical protein